MSGKVISASQSANTTNNITVRKACHVDASITQSPRKPKTKPAYEVVSDREEGDDEADAQAAMRIIEVTQPGMDSEARWVRKGGQSVLAISNIW